MNGNLLVRGGGNQETYRSERALSRRITIESEKYLEAPVSAWPRIIFNWDYSRTSQRFSKDGASPEEFDKAYPNGFRLGLVVLAEFDEKLCFFSRRKDRDLWSIGDPFKLAYLIVYLSEGRPISPPLATPMPTREIVIDGGHHRYAVAKAIGLAELPVYVTPRHKEDLESLIKVRWISS